MTTYKYILRAIKTDDVSTLTEHDYEVKVRVRMKGYKYWIMLNNAKSVKYNNKYVMSNKEFRTNEVCLHYFNFVHKNEINAQYPTVPVQSTFPSPEYPVKHWQEYDPFALVQFAFSWQRLGNLVHSLISTKLLKRQLVATNVRRKPSFSTFGNSTQHFNQNIHVIHVINRKPHWICVCYTKSYRINKITHCPSHAVISLNINDGNITIK